MATHARRPGLEGGISLRLATGADVDGIVQVLQAAFTPLADQYTAASFAATVPPPHVIRSRLGTCRIWVAVEGAAVVGTVTARVTPEGIYVQSMAVLPSLRGAGVGRRLLDAAIQFAEEAKAPRLYLSTTPFLAAAIRLYESAGFRRVPAEGPFDLHGTPLLTMERRL